MKRYFFVFFLTSLILSGCARAPVRPAPPYHPAQAPIAGGTYYTVMKGDTLYRLSKTYGVEVSELMRVNRISSPTQLEPGQRLFVPRKPVYVPAPAAPLYEPVSIETVRRIVGPKQFIYSWQTITVHHSGTFQGSARLFDRDHRRRKMGGLFYHFVIGNGTSTPMGTVEVGWRWKKQVKANRAHDIQICLVGNFDKERVPEGELASLVNLVKVLREQYGIPVSGIRRHCDIHGKPTECPGKYFPFNELLARVS